MINTGIPTPTTAEDLHRKLTYTTIMVKSELVIWYMWDSNFYIIVPIF